MLKAGATLFVSTVHSQWTIQQSEDLQNHSTPWTVFEMEIKSIVTCFLKLWFLLLFIFLIPWSTFHAILLETLKISPPLHLIWILWLFSLSHLSFFASQIQNRTLSGSKKGKETAGKAFFFFFFCRLGEGKGWEYF